MIRYFVESLLRTDLTYFVSSIFVINLSLNIPRIRLNASNAQNQLMYFSYFHSNERELAQKNLKHYDFF